MSLCCSLFRSGRSCGSMMQSVLIHNSVSCSYLACGLGWQTRGTLDLGSSMREVVYMIENNREAMRMRGGKGGKSRLTANYSLRSMV